MSQDDVEIVTASIDAWNAGEFDALQEFYAPDAVVVPDTSVFPEAGRMHGRKEWRRWAEEIRTPWANPRWEIGEVVVVEDGRVLVRGDWGGHGVASGIEVSSSITGIYTIRDGVILHVEYFFDHDKALKAVGLA